MNRRDFLSSAGLAVASHSLGKRAPAQAAQVNSRPAGKADHTLRIEPCTLEIGPGVMVKTLSYNGQVPGPLLRLREGVPVTIDVTNGGTDPDIVHWHGLAIDSLNDGAMEEGSPDDRSRPDPSLHVHAEASGHALVSHARRRLRQSGHGHLHGPVRISAGRGQRIRACSRPGGQPRHSPLGALVRAHGRDHARSSRRTCR